MKAIVLGVVLIGVTGCAHHGAVRVQCDGVLRPVNAPIESHEPPVSVGSKDATEAKRPERRP
jgi:hypothetical protein